MFIPFFEGKFDFYTIFGGKFDFFGTKSNYFMSKNTFHNSKSHSSCGRGLSLLEKLKKCRLKQCFLLLAFCFT